MLNEPREWHSQDYLYFIYKTLLAGYKCVHAWNSAAYFSFHI